MSKSKTPDWLPQLTTSDEFEQELTTLLDELAELRDDVQKAVTKLLDMKRRYRMMVLAEAHRPKD